MKIPAIVIGASVTALGTLRSLAQKGITVFMDCDENDLVRLSRFYNHFDFLSEDRTQIDFDKLASLDFDKMVLIPCSDPFVQQVANIPDKYKSRMLVSSCSEQALSTLLYKDHFLKQVIKTQVNAPTTHLLEDETSLSELSEESFENAFLKPISSASFEQVYGAKALFVDNKLDAIDKYQNIRNNGLQVVLQTYVPGPSSNHYFVDGFVDRHGQVKAIFARRRLRIYPPDFGNSCFMKSVPKSEVSSAIEDVSRLLKSINYRGIFSAEFKKDVNSGQLNIIEVNARCWWYVAFATDSGINTPWLAYQDALDQDVESIENYPVGKRCAYPYCDFNSYRRAKTKETGFFSMVFSWLGASQPIFTWKDPLPAVISSFRILTNFIKKRK